MHRDRHLKAAFGAWIWALIVAACTLHLVQVWRSDAVRFDSDLLSLLPRASADDGAALAVSRLSENASRRIVVVLEGANETQVIEAARRVDAVLRESSPAASSPLTSPPAAAVSLQQIIDFYAPYRAGLLDAAERARIDQATDERLGAEAVAKLFRPGAGMRTMGLGDDPAGSFGSWLAARASATPLRPIGDSGFIGMPSARGQSLVLPYELSATAMSISTLEALDPRLTTARALAAAAGVEMLTAGVPVHAAAAAQRAQFEMSTIGLGAMLVIALLMIVSFRSARPLLMVLTSVAVGVLVAVSVSLLMFDRVHLITLVFGASLVGVAEDYGIHYIAMRALGQHSGKRHLVDELWPTLALAFGTTALGYIALGVAPFPGLRQIAVFSVVGLLAALLSVVLWFPHWESHAIQSTAFSRWIAGTRRHWPLLRFNAQTLIAAGVVAAILGIGIAKLSSSDDLRAMQAAPKDLVAQQQRISKLLGESSPVQFYLVRGVDEEELLQREEVLTSQLTQLQRAGVIGGYRAISDWVPSARLQLADRARSERQNSAASAAMEATLGESPAPSRAQSSATLNVSDWLPQAIAEPLRAQWLGESGDAHASVVMITGLNDPAQLPRLAALASNLEGVRWIDLIADYSSLLRTYRVAISYVLAGSLRVIYLLLLPKFGRHAWRVVTPTAIAALCVLAVLGYSAQPLTLFHILGVLVLLGMGTDYGIFLTEPDPSGAPWLAVGLGAVSTLLAFGLLAFSHTPALAAFGLTLLIGIAIVWLLSPCLCAEPGATEYA